MRLFRKSSNNIKNIGFISTRIAGTDGVSLEIEKWAEVLQRNNYDCFYYAGESDRTEERCYLVEEAHFEHPDIKRISEIVFGTRIRPKEISDQVEKIKNKLKSTLYDFRKKFDLDLIIPENALAIPMNIPLGIAITEFIAETGIFTIAHHHDFSWERDRFLINACNDYLQMAFPPDLPSIFHAVINSLASQQLSHRVGISNTVIPNVFNFARKPPKTKDHCAELREVIGLAQNDLFVLQPTRIVARKRIERSIEFVRCLNLSNPLLVVSHASGDEGDEYFQRVCEYAQTMNVNLAFISHLVSTKPEVNFEGKSFYSIGEVYQCADLVTYPSGYEGFGNAFLEAIYYKKPILVNRYSIYIVDIEPKGFDVILMDEFVSSKAIEQVEKLFADKTHLEEMVENNYALATKWFSFEVLEERLIHIIHSFKP
ncbi:MAG: glycosyltransferase [bacterium]